MQCRVKKLEIFLKIKNKQTIYLEEIKLKRKQKRIKFVIILFHLPPPPVNNNNKYNKMGASYVC